jgi:hypothetical protein
MESVFCAEDYYVSHPLGLVERNTQTRDFAYVHQCGGAHKQKNILVRARTDCGYHNRGYCDGQTSIGQSYLHNFTVRFVWFSAQTRLRVHQYSKGYSGESMTSAAAMS